MPPHPFDDSSVEAAFDAIGEPARSALLRLRSAILDAAASTDGVGALEETLKWGQPAYLTPATKSGSTIRLGVPKSPAHDHALFVHCQTDLTEQFETNYPGLFDFEGTRAVLLDSRIPIPEEALRHCIALALTYRLRKR